MILRHETRGYWQLISTYLLIATLVRNEVKGQCFGGTETYEKTAGVKFLFGASQGILTQPGTGITRDCTAICRQTPTCAAFTVDYENSRCQSYSVDSSGHRGSLHEKVGSNFFEKICLRGVSDLTSMCGDRLWAFERVVGAYLEEFDDKEERNIQTKTECEKLCLFETSFTCRSAEFDESAGICRLSREDRRSQPNAFRRQPGSTVDYLENQCVRPLPDCRYSVRQGSAVVSMDELQFAASQGECEALCDQARGFTCRAFTYAMVEKRCYLSGDDSVSLNSAPLNAKRDAIYAEKQCSISQCEDGLFTFEKVTGHFLRSAQQVGLAMATSPGVTLECGARCLEAGSDCPAFSLDYTAMKCYKLDRNTQGRGSELSPREGQSYFEKICLRGAVRGCEGRAWAFERRPGKELRGYDDLVLNLIQSRRDCMEACLSEQRFVCRSAEYDTQAAVCKLSSEDRRTRSADYVDAPNNIEYIENQCLPPETGCSFKSVANSYPRYLDLVLPQVLDERDCERRCYDYSDFICRSFSFYQSGVQCFISSDDRASAGTEAYMNRPGTNYYERNCQAGPGGHLGAGGLGHPGQGGVGGGGNARCNVGRAEFEKVTGFELSGRQGFTLVRESVPGLAVQCAALCKQDARCHGFNLDYTRNECAAVEGDPDVARIDLRPVSGVAHFQGVCLRGQGCGLAWTYERHINMELRGFTNAQYPGVTKIECEDLCLDEVSFICRSASYNIRRQECRLSAEDRYSQPQAFVAALDSDYLENQCVSVGGRCVYRNQQRDRQLIYTDKSLSSFSDSSCQHACDVEREFACRSYSFLSQTGSTTAQCLLSGSTGSGAGGFLSVSGALYAEKECTPPPPGFRPDSGAPSGYPLGPGGPLGVAPLGPAVGSGRYPPGGRYPQGPLMPSGPGRYPVGPALPPGPGRYPQGVGPPPGRYPIGPGGGIGPGRYPQGGPGGSGGFSQGGPGGYPQGPGPGGYQQGSGPGGYPLPAAGSGRYPAGGEPNPSLAPYPCRHTLTYEKIAGATYGGAQREPLRTRSDIGISAECLVQCAELRERCLGVAIENLRGGRQRCYALQRSADADNSPLQAAPDLAYFQKICLVERPCAKAWVFTRVPGYELATSSGVEVRNVFSRRQCQEECLREARVVCRSASYYARERLCKISPQTRRTQPQLFKRASPDVDYLENECAQEPPNCEYTDIPGRLLPYTDRYIPKAFDVAECKHLCDKEREFSCRSFNFHMQRRECFLSSDDTFTADRSALVTDPDYFYSEHDSCSNVRVDCTQADMLITFLFGTGFEGRVYATGNPQACFEMGNGQAQLVLRIPMGTQCGTVQQGRGRYVNHVVIQQNPVIMQETDKTVRVECSFDAADQTVSYAPSGTRDQQGGGLSVTVPFKPSGTNIVTNTAPTPNVRMRIVTRQGQEAAVVGLGDELQLKIDIDPTSAFGIFVRNLEARTENGELLTLIDNVGCPRDPNIFPALQIQPRTRDLFADFKAFRFPSTATVNFVATVQFCQDICEPIRCNSGVPSFGRRRRSIDNGTDTEMWRDDASGSIPTSNTTETLLIKQSDSVADTTTRKLLLPMMEYSDTATQVVLHSDAATQAPEAGTSVGELVGERVTYRTYPPPSRTYPPPSRTYPPPISVTNKEMDQDLEDESSSNTSAAVNYSETMTSSTAPPMRNADDQPGSMSSSPPPKPAGSTTKQPERELPDELPLQLRLVVGEDSLPRPTNKKGSDNRYHGPITSYDSNTIGRDGYAEASSELVCSTVATVITSVLSLLIFNGGLLTAFLLFYRRRKKQWVKAELNDRDRFPVHVPEVLFKSVYDRLPNRPGFSSLANRLHT